MKANVVLYEFSSRTVATCNLDAFLKVYACHKLPVGAELRALMGRTVFSLAGYHDERRELYVMPEVRRFCVALHQVWPYWLFFCDLEQDDLRVMTFCCLPRWPPCKWKDKPMPPWLYSRSQLDTFVHADLPFLKEMSDRAGLWGRAAARRVEAVFAYFQLPAHGEPLWKTDDHGTCRLPTQRQTDCLCGSLRRWSNERMNKSLRPSSGPLSKGDRLVKRILLRCGRYYQGAELFYQRLWKQHFNQMGFRVILVEKLDCHHLWRIHLRGSLTTQSFLLLSKSVSPKFMNAPDVQEKQLAAEVRRIAQDLGLPLKRDCLSVSRTGAYFQISFLWPKGRPGLLLRSEFKPQAFRFLIRPRLRLIRN
jgi:hypothetical protein